VDAQDARLAGHREPARRNTASRASVAMPVELLTMAHPPPEPAAAGPSKNSPRRTAPRRCGKRSTPAGGQGVDHRVAAQRRGRVRAGVRERARRRPAALDGQIGLCRETRWAMRVNRSGLPNVSR
jgi:hypothetical protein